MSDRQTFFRLHFIFFIQKNSFYLLTFFQLWVNEFFFFDFYYYYLFFEIVCVCAVSVAFLEE